MGATNCNVTSWDAVHADFLGALPRIDRAIRHEFRRWPAHDRAEAIADAQAAAWHAWYGLIRRGKDPLAVGPTGIARNACRYTRAGRQLGCGTRGRAVMDIYDHRARRRLGLTLVRLDQRPDADAGGRPEAWREWLAGDDRVTPADEACFRLDFEEWLGRLPARRRQVAELLAEGHETGVVAERLGVTPSAVSQARTWLEADWREFQGDAAHGTPAVRRPRGRPKGSGRAVPGRQGARAAISA